MGEFIPPPPRENFVTTCVHVSTKYTCTSKCSPPPPPPNFKSLFMKWLFSYSKLLRVFFLAVEAVKLSDAAEYIDAVNSHGTLLSLSIFSQSHPNRADEAWYQLKCVLHIG